MSVTRTAGLDHVAIAVSDLERSSRFYEEVIGLERAYDEWHEPVFMLAAGGPGTGSGLALFREESHPSSGDQDAVAAIRVLHLAFRVDRAGFDAARAALPERGIETSFTDHGSCHSLYFSDPDGHQLELTTYDV